MSADSSDNDEYPARGWKTLQLDTRDALLFLAKNHQHQRFDALPPRAPGHVCFITCRAAVAIWQKMKLSSEKWSSIVHLNMKSPLITKQTAQHTSHCWHKWVGRKMGWLNSYCKRLLENGSPLGSPHFLASGQITSCLPLKDYWCPSFFFDSEESGTFRNTRHQPMLPSHLLLNINNSWVSTLLKSSCKSGSAVLVDCNAAPIGPCRR